MASSIQLERVEKMYSRNGLRQGERMEVKMEEEVRAHDHSDHGDHKKKEEEDMLMKQQPKQQQPLQISEMKPVTEGAYGGGLYGTEKEMKQQLGEHHDQEEVKEGTGYGEQRERRLPASNTQSADGPVSISVEPKHKPPPSSGDRDIDITGQSYIQ